MVCERIDVRAGQDRIRTRQNKYGNMRSLWYVYRSRIVVEGTERWPTSKLRQSCQVASSADDDESLVGVAEHAIEALRKYVVLRGFRDTKQMLWAVGFCSTSLRCLCSLLKGRSLP